MEAKLTVLYVFKTEKNNNIFVCVVCSFKNSGTVPVQAVWPE